MDEIDRAQAEAEAFLERALAASHNILAEGAPSDFCEDCGEEIPVPRRLAYPGCTRCVDCQASVEGKRS